MTTTAGAAGSGVGVTAPNVRLTFQYDYLGRRVSRKIEDWAGSSWGQREELRFVYNGWNLLAEMTTSGTIQRYFTWGLDLSGSGSAMGGIGALLMVQDGGQTYFPGYDGNGNVAAMLYANNGSAAALYEYNPFGESLRAQGAYAATNRFRFSTKFTDQDTGLSYYGLRFYSASLGRFINRDPIGEQGGMNLYGFANNDPVNGWDLLGMDTNDGCYFDLITNTVVCNPPPADPESDPPSDSPSSGSASVGYSGNGGAVQSSHLRVDPYQDLMRQVARMRAQIEKDCSAMEDRMDMLDHKLTKDSEVLQKILGDQSDAATLLLMGKAATTAAGLVLGHVASSLVTARILAGLAARAEATLAGRLFTNGLLTSTASETTAYRALTTPFIRTFYIAPARLGTETLEHVSVELAPTGAENAMDDLLKTVEQFGGAVETEARELHRVREQYQAKCGAR